MATDTKPDIDTDADTAEVTTPALPGASLYLLDVEQYHAMARAGILDEGAPVELLEGMLVSKMTKLPPHVIATKLVHLALSRTVPAGWHVGQEAPVVFLPRNEPEPDFSVVRGEIRDYSQRDPGPEDVGLLIEVADSSPTRDRQAKLRIYAGAGVPVYWIINLVDRQVEVYTGPTGPRYAQRTDFGPDDAAPLCLDGQEVARLAVRDLLP